MALQKRSQKFAVAAHTRVAARTDAERKTNKEYVTFAKKFPALIHTCGLAQSIAFALAKDHTAYIADLAAVLKAIGHSNLSTANDLNQLACNELLGGYMRLSRDSLQAASWLKRYVEVLGEGE